MSELVHEFSKPVQDEDGNAHTVRIRGEPDDNEHWYGWLEFVPTGGGPALRTGRETTQSRRQHLEYWATGLSEPYLEQALRRAAPADGADPPPPPEEPALDPAKIREDGGASPAVTVEIVTLDPGVPRRLMGLDQLPVGAPRRVDGGGLIVYDGMDADEGGPSTYRFLVQYGSENVGAVILGNRLWTALRDEPVKLVVGGREVPVRSHEIIEALRTG